MQQLGDTTKFRDRVGEWIKRKCSNARREMQNRDKGYRLLVLMQMAREVAPYNPYWGHKKARKERAQFMAGGKAGRKDAWRKPCYVCGKKGFCHAHHIIAIKNGGINIRQNIIPLCLGCHESVHGFKFKGAKCKASNKS